MLLFWLRRFIKPRTQASQSRKSRPWRKHMRPRFELLEDRNLLSAGVYATAADAGGQPLVKVYDAASGAEKMSIMAYDSAFTGGVRVAVGDVNGDGTPDIITAPGAGGGPDIHVFDGASGQLIRQFFAFDPRFAKGEFVASGDVNGDGASDIIVGADQGGGPNVVVFSGNDNSILDNFFAYDPRFIGGVRVAASDVNGDGKADIITGAGPGGGPNVSILSGANGSVLSSYFAYDPRFTLGINVAAGDVNGDGVSDVVVGADQGGGPNVVAFSGTDNSTIQNFFAFDPRFIGGVRVSTADVNGTAQIVVTPGPGGGADVVTVDATTGTTTHRGLSDDPSSCGLFTGGDGGVTTNSDPTAVATHFGLSIARNSDAGASSPVYVVALDASNRVVANYAGTVQFTSSDSAATLPDNYTFKTSDRGRHLFQVTFATTGSQTVMATDTSTSSLTGSVTTNVTPPAVVTHFFVQTAEDAQVGQPVSVLVTALDASNHIVTNYAGTVQLTSSDKGATLPAAYTFLAGDHGRHAFQVTFAATGSQTLTATDTSDSTIIGSVSTNVEPAAVATHLAVSIERNVQSGAAASVVVAALDASNHIVPNYVGTIQFTSSDTGATLPSAYSFAAGDHGRHVFQVTFATTGSQTLTATDSADSTISGSTTVNVNPAVVATHFAISMAPSVMVGQDNSVLVVALDASNHIVPNYTGTVHFTSTDSSAILPADYTFTTSDLGHHVFSVTFATTGSQTLTATDTADATVTASHDVTVNPAPVATHLGISIEHDAKTGQAIAMLVVALDASNHLVPKYTGTVHFTSSDAAATLPADYTFVASDVGKKIFQLTFGTAGSQKVTVTDTADSTIKGNGSVQVR